jgi:hypothetical protein
MYGRPYVIVTSAFAIVALTLSCGLARCRGAARAATASIHTNAAAMTSVVLRK